MRFRRYLAAAVVCLALLVSDLVQRLIIRPWVKLLPSRRTTVLRGWLNLMAWVVTAPVRRVGGGRIPRPLRAIPGGPGVLILMNHQSLFDIPLVVQAVDGGYPRIVTRKRYSRGIPLISHMIGLYEYPVVQPSANPSTVRETLDDLAAAAADAEQPIVIFPEGTRSRDGEIGRFKSAGLSTILAARPWTVYVVVADGFWSVVTFDDFLKRMDQIRGRIEVAGVLEWTDPAADPAPFVFEVRALMVERLAAMRGQAT